MNRLKEDPGFLPNSPVLTVQLSEDGTRGFSMGLEQLKRHKAMWLPEQDAFVTLADSPARFTEHLACCERLLPQSPKTMDWCLQCLG